MIICESGRKFDDSAYQRWMALIDQDYTMAARKFIDEVLSKIPRNKMKGSTLSTMRTLEGIINDPEDPTLWMRSPNIKTAKDATVAAISNLLLNQAGYGVISVGPRESINNIAQIISEDIDVDKEFRQIDMIVSRYGLRLYRLNNY